MSEFSIEITKTNDIVNKMATLKNSINRSAYLVNNANNRLKRNRESSLSIIGARLSELHESIINEAAKAESLADALRQIVMLYNSAETAIVGSAEEYMVADSQASTESEKSWYEKLISWIKEVLGIKETELSAERKAEKKHDLYMQSEIFALLDTDRFSKSAWQSATVTERKRIMNEFMTEIALIMGISVCGSISFESFENPNTRGMHTSDDNKIHINKDKLNRSDSYSLMQTLIHEMRHAYQHAAVENPENFNVSSETIEQWKENFKPGVYYRGEDYQRYVSQPIEYDAKSFAKQNTDLFGTKPTYSGSW